MNDGVICPAEAFKFHGVPIYWLLILVPVLMVFCSESLFLLLMSLRLFTVLSFIMFSVSGFMIRSLNSLKLSFVQGNKYGSIWILQHAIIQFDQYHLLKMLSYFQCVFFYKKKSGVHCYVDLYLNV